VVECDTSSFEQDDDVEVDLDTGSVHVRNRGTVVSVVPLPPVMQAIVTEGGIAPYLARYGKLSGLVVDDDVRLGSPTRGRSGHE
jgi:3-isopropylmalate dehydratase small subunit